MKRLDLRLKVNYFVADLRISIDEAQHINYYYDIIPCNNEAKSALPNFISKIKICHVVIHVSVVHTLLLTVYDLLLKKLITSDTKITQKTNNMFKLGSCCSFLCVYIWFLCVVLFVPCVM